MQKRTIPILILISTIISTSLFSQSKEEYEEVLNLIESYEFSIDKLKAQLDKSSYEQKELKFKKAEVEKNLKIQRNSIKDSLTKVYSEAILHDELTSLEEQLNDEKTRYYKINKRLLNNVKKIKEYRKINKKLIEKNAELTAKLDTILKNLSWANTKSDNSKEDLSKKCYMESYIKNYDIGTKDKKGNIVSYYKFKDGEHIPFNKGIGKKLTHLHINDAEFSELINETAIHFDDLVKGKILLYADGRLNSKIDCSLIKSKKNFYSNINSFELMIETELETPLEHGAKINLAFITNEVYKNSNKSVLKSFVESNDKGHFLISSKKPQDIGYYYRKEGIKFNDSDIIASHSENIKIRLFDFDDLDGDKISLFLNGKKIISNLELPHKSNPFEKNIKLRKGDNILKLELTSQGSVGGCTASYDLYYIDGQLLKQNQRIVKPPNKSFPPLLIYFGSSL